ncbi:MAG: marine proteobacterial sortase target protein [Colwellia sp.]
MLKISQKVSMFTSLIVLNVLFVNVSEASINSQKASKAQHFQTIPYDDIKTGSLFVKNESGFHASLSQNSIYDVKVTGLLARVNLTQTFKNDSDSFIEAVYVFPLHNEAAVDALTMKIGDRVINGVIKEKHQAKKIYNKAKKQGKKTSLVAQHRPNMFSTKLANIAPGETVEVVLSYLQSVKYHDSEFSLRLPLTITPRFIPVFLVKKNDDQNNKHQGNMPVESTKPSAMENTRQHGEIDLNSTVNPVNITKTGWLISSNVKDAKEITSPQVSSSPSQNVKINIELNAGMALSNINSHYHPITKRKTKRKTKVKTNTKAQPTNPVKTDQIATYQVSLLNAQTKMDRDFTLSWQLAEGNKPEAAFFSSQDDNYHYGLLMLMPEQSPHKSNSHQHNIAKDITYIIDTSGSMGGVAIKQAKKALVNAINQLNSADSFNIIAFAGSPTSLYNEPQEANQQNLLQAIYWVERLTASGGTNMYPAIELALNQAPAKENKLYNKYKQVIFITDGAVGNEDELIAMISRKIGSTRLHTVGIGSAPNGYFMTQAALIGKGTHRFIGSINEVEKEMDSLIELINNPSMKDIALSWSVNQVEMIPDNLPDLYLGQPLVISARWPNNAINNQQTLKVSATGKQANKVWNKELALSHVNNSSGISTWWARQKVKQLRMTMNRPVPLVEKEALKKQITQLGLTHSLVTPFTSFIAVENKISRKQHTALNSQKVANLIPKGSSQLISLSNTSLGSFSYLLLGILLMFVSILLHFSYLSKAIVNLLVKRK